MVYYLCSIRATDTCCTFFVCTCCSGSRWCGPPVFDGRRPGHVLGKWRQPGKPLDPTQDEEGNHHTVSSRALVNNLQNKYLAWPWPFKPEFVPPSKRRILAAMYKVVTPWFSGKLEFMINRVNWSLWYGKSIAHNILFHRKKNVFVRARH